jgi:FtsH-binding integral membrane protein
MHAVSLPRTKTHIQINSFLRSVYNWMAVGLGLTGLCAYYVANNADLQQLIFGNSLVFFGLVLVELGLVFFISARIHKLASSTATGLFLLYSALNGATISALLLIYAHTTIYSAFFICAATFVVSSIYGMMTRRDLTSFGNFIIMGLIGIIIASLVNLFLHSSAMSLIISYIGVMVFTGLTAYETQRLKTMAQNQPDGLDAGVIRKGAVLGALSLYLNFINLFIMLLSVIGASRE